ncbi:MAG TPA: hypothetical protein PK850_00185 [Ignavibacteria bacterium]|nr:hypothetical protein [Ignavibacteria bacterium]HRJ86610.1 hypothetical protein [Ignavibacteria bacterium]
MKKDFSDLKKCSIYFLMCSLLLGLTFFSTGCEEDESINSVTNDAEYCFFTESNDSGRTWSNIDYFGPEVKKLYSGVLIGSTGTYLVCGTNSQDQGAIWRSVDHGENWTQVKSELDNFSQIIENYYSGSVIFAVSESNTDRKLFRSTDDGNTWTELSLPNASKVVPVSFSERWLATEYSDIKYSDDNGDTWQTAYSTSNNPVYDIQYPQNGSGTAVAVYTGGILRSTNRGENWSIVLPETFTGGTYLSIGNDGNGICFEGSGNGNQEQYKTNDFGATWVFNGTFTNYQFNDLLTLNQNLIILSTGEGIKISTDMGTTFTSTSVNFVTRDINYVGGEYMFVLGGR